MSSAILPTDIFAMALLTYGDEGLFRQKLEAGYERVGFGSGQPDGSEIVRAWFFFKPDGTVAACEFRKRLGAARYEGPFEAVYHENQFQEYLNRRKITPQGPREQLRIAVEDLSAPVGEPLPDDADAAQPPNTA